MDDGCQAVCWRKFVGTSSQEERAEAFTEQASKYFHVSPQPKRHPFVVDGQRYHKPRHKRHKVRENEGQIYPENLENEQIQSGHIYLPEGNRTPGRDN